MYRQYSQHTLSMTKTQMRTHARTHTNKFKSKEALNAVYHHPSQFCLPLDEQLKAFLPMFLKQTTHVQEMLLCSSRCRCWWPKNVVPGLVSDSTDGLCWPHIRTHTSDFGAFQQGRIFWLQPHSAPVGICHRTALAGFHFSFVFFFNN